MDTTARASPMWSADKATVSSTSEIDFRRADALSSLAKVPVRRAECCGTAEMEDARRP